MKDKKSGLEVFKRCLVLTILGCMICIILIGCSGGTSKKPDEATLIVIDEINRLENADVVSLEELEKAKERYNSLTDNQKEKVTNYATLLKLEDNYEEVGKIPLTPENYSDYLKIGYKNSFFKEIGWEGDNKVYKNMEVIVAALGVSDEYEFENVKIEVKVGGGYYPLSNLSGAKYGLRAGTSWVDIDETVSFSCDGKGNGSESSIISVSDSKYGEGAFSTDSSHSPEISLSVISISGTVLPNR